MRCWLKNTEQVGASDDTIARETGRSSKLTVEEQLVETAFAYPGTLSEILKYKFDLWHQTGKSICINPILLACNSNTSSLKVSERSIDKEKS